MPIGFIGSIEHLNQRLPDRSLEARELGFRIGSFMRQQALEERKQAAKEKQQEGEMALAEERQGEEKQQNEAQRGEWTSMQKYRDAQISGLEQAQTLQDLRITQEQQKMDNAVRRESSKAQFMDAMKGIDENGWWGRPEGMKVMHDIGASMPWATDTPEWAEAMKYHDTAAKAIQSDEIANSRIDNAYAIQQMRVQMLEQSISERDRSRADRDAIATERNKLEEMRIEIQRDRLESGNDKALRSEALRMFDTLVRSDMSADEAWERVNKAYPGAIGPKQEAQPIGTVKRFQLDPNSPRLLPKVP